MNAGEISQYGLLLGEIKGRIHRAQHRAAVAASREMLVLYWEIGKVIEGQQQLEGWGARVLRRLALDLKSELPGVKGFSERNLKRMLQFYRAYPQLFSTVVSSAQAKGPPAVALLAGDDEQVHELRSLVARIPWAHNVLLLQKIKNTEVRRWYMRQTLQQGWSRDVLALMLKNSAHERQGQATTNFDELLTPPLSDLAQQTLKDPYVFDFLTLDTSFRERELEAGLVRHLERFLLELGVGFAFVGRQVRLQVEDDPFYLDMLFYHLKLRCYVVVELKVGAFKPEFAGKMNFYLNVVDDNLRHEGDGPSIGLILCQDKKKVLAEYALRGVNKPIGVSEYELTRALPNQLESALPTIEDIEAELSRSGE